MRKAGSSGSIERERSSPWKRLRAPILGPGSRPMAVAWRLPSAGARSDVWICDLSRNTWHPLTTDGDSFLPVWSHDGTRVAFSSSRGGVPNLFWVRADGSGVAELLMPSEYPQYPHSWSADGKLLFRQRSSSTTGSGDVGLQRAVTRGGAQAPAIPHRGEQ